MLSAGAAGVMLVAGAVKPRFEMRISRSSPLTTPSPFASPCCQLEPVKALANHTWRSRLSTVPSRLKSPAYVAITVTVWADVSSSNPSVRPVAVAVESRNWPMSHFPLSQLALTKL